MPAHTEPHDQNQEQAVHQNNRATDASKYEPPVVETVLTKEQLEREIHYAGIISGGA